MSFLYSYPSKVDKSKYQENVDNLQAFYGLPQEIKFCNRCVISNQKPNSSVEFYNDGNQVKKAIRLDDSGICDACRVTEYKSKIDWNEREKELRDICDRFRRSDGGYDCLVPGSGGKDSFMTAHLLKYKYGMNPLTCTWAPHIYTNWGWSNHNAWVHAGFDNILFTPNGKVHRILTRLSTEKIFYPFQPFILGQKIMAPKIAYQYNINLIFYGENQAEYGNPKEDMKSSTMSSNFFSSTSEEEMFIGGTSLSELKEIGLNKAEWNAYIPIDRNIIEQNNIKYYYLGYFEKWHPQGAYYYSVDNGKFQASPERTTGTYNTYNSIDDKIDDFHYHTTYIKFGIGRASYDAAQEIRSGDLMREEGVSLVKRFDGEFPERWANEIFEYLSLPESEFPRISKFFEKPIFDRQYYDVLSDNARSPHLWKWDKNIGWELRHKVYEGKNNPSQEMTAKLWQGNQ